MRETGEWSAGCFAVVSVLLLGFQLARILLVPPPLLVFDTATALEPAFTDSRCAGMAITAASYDNKWSFHPGDGMRESRCVSRALTTAGATRLLIRYAGNPTDDLVRAGIDSDGDDAIDLPWRPGPAARHGWLLSVVELPASGTPFRVIIEDRSRRPDGWFVVGDMVAFTGTAHGLTGIRPWPRTLAAAWAIALAGGVLWFGMRGQRRAAAIGLAALLSVVFLQMSSFYFKDEYVLLGTWADGIRWRELVSYYDQFAPLFLPLYAGSVALVRDWYAPLQVTMLLGHIMNVLLLVRLLATHGFAHWLALSIGLLFATAWTHIDVVPWYIEGCFLISTGLILLALECTAARASRHPRSLVWAGLACVLAPLVFAGGVIAPWLCLAYILIFSPRDRAATAMFAAVGVISCGIVIAGSSALDTARSVTGSASPSQMLAYLFEGVFASALTSLLALRGHTALVLAGLAAVGAAILVFSYVRTEPTRAMLSLAFGLVFMLSAYALQALVRTGTGFGDAMSFRYTYLGMAGAAFALAAWLQPLVRPWQAGFEPLRRLLAGGWLTACLVAVGVNTSAFHGFSDVHEREYFDISRQYFALTRAAIIESDTSGTPLPPGLVPKTLYPGNQDATPADLTRRYREVVCMLVGCRHAPQAELAVDAGSGWHRLLVPPPQ